MARLLVRGRDGFKKIVESSDYFKTNRRSRGKFRSALKKVGIELKKRIKKYGYLTANVEIGRDQRKWYGFRKRRGKRLRRMRGWAKNATMTHCAIADRFIKRTR